MKIIRLEFLKLKKKTRTWLGPVLVFWLMMIAYPLTVEFLQEKLEVGFFSVLWIAILISMMLATEDIFLEDFNDGTLPLLYMLPLPIDKLLRKKLYALCGLAAHLIVSIGVTGLWLNVFFFFTFQDAAIYAQATFGLSALMIIYVLNSATVAMSVQDQPYVFSLLLNLVVTLLYALVLQFNIFVGITLIWASWTLCLRRFQAIASH